MFWMQNASYFTISNFGTFTNLGEINQFISSSMAHIERWQTDTQQRKTRQTDRNRSNQVHKEILWRYGHSHIQFHTRMAACAKRLAEIALCETHFNFVWLYSLALQLAKLE